VFGFDSTNALVWNGNIATPLGNLPGGVTALAWAINDTGQIAGFNNMNPVVDILNPIRWDGTVPTQLDTLGGGFMTFGSGINNHEQIVGGSWTGTGFHAVRWDGTAITDLGTLGGSESTALGINNAGIAVGYAYTTNDDAYHAVRWDGNIITDLGTLSGNNSDAWAINDFGQIAGDSLLADGETTHAVLWNGSTLTDLAALGGTGTTSFSEDINNAGQIAGWSEVAVGSSHATLWDGASLIDLNDFLPSDLANAGWVLTEAKGINDHGVIVGWAQNSLDPETALLAAFKLTPTAVPVPGAIWLFGSALGGLVGMTRRKQGVAA